MKINQITLISCSILISSISLAGYLQAFDIPTEAPSGEISGGAFGNILRNILVNDDIFSTTNDWTVKQSQSIGSGGIIVHANIGANSSYLEAINNGSESILRIGTVGNLSGYRGGLISIGHRAGRNLNQNTSSTSHNITIGSLAGGSLTTEGANTMVGSSAGGSLQGSSNALFGGFAGSSWTSGDANTFIGTSAGQAPDGETRSGSNNIVIGQWSNVASGDNQLSIGNALFGKGLSNNSLKATNPQIGIGTDNPQHTLEINGTLGVVTNLSTAGTTITGGVVLERSPNLSYLSPTLRSNGRIEMYPETSRWDSEYTVVSKGYLEKELKRYANSYVSPDPEFTRVITRSYYSGGPSRAEYSDPINAVADKVIVGIKIDASGDDAGKCRLDFPNVLGLSSISHAWGPGGVHIKEFKIPDILPGSTFLPANQVSNLISQISNDDGPGSVTCSVDIKYATIITPN